MSGCVYEDLDGHKIVVGGCNGVAMQLLNCFKWLSVHCWWLLGCSRWLLGVASGCLGVSM